MSRKQWGSGTVYLPKEKGRSVYRMIYYGPGPDGTGSVRYSASTGKKTEKAAREVLGKKIREIERAREDGTPIETAASRNLTVAEVLDAHLKRLEAKGAKGLRNEICRFGINKKGEPAPLRAALGDIKVSKLTTARLDEFIAERRAEGCANATISRDLEGLRTALRRAQRDGRILRIPNFPDRLRGRVREGFYERDEVDALCAAAEKAEKPWLAEMIRFAFATGWRRGELLGLRWEWIKDDEIRLPVGSTKNDRGRVVPIAGELVAIMERLRGMRGVPQKDGSVLLSKFVFHDAGEPITRKRFGLAWNAARKDAKVGGKIFHDFRRSAARRMIRAGVPQVVIKRIMGHETDAMFNRYAIIESEEQARGFEAVQERESVEKKRSSGNVREFPKGDR